jgi:predicted phage-related endonuclease
MGKINHENTVKGKVPEFYLVQCHYNLAVSGARVCYFISYYPECGDMAVVEVTLSDERRHKLLAIVKDWWDYHVVRDIPPELKYQDRILLTDEYSMALCREYKKSSASDRKLIRGRLCELTSVAMPSVSCAGVSIVRNAKGGFRVTVSEG